MRHSACPRPEPSSCTRTEGRREPARTPFPYGRRAVNQRPALPAASGQRTGTQLFRIGQTLGDFRSSDTDRSARSAVTVPRPGPHVDGRKAPFSRLSLWTAGRRTRSIPHPRWASTRISTSLAGSERASNTSQLSTRASIRYASRKATASDHAALAPDDETRSASRESADQRQ